MNSFNYRYSSKKEAEAIEFIDYVMSKEYGETLPISTCAYMLKYNIDDERELKKFRSIMARIRNALIDKGYVLKSIPNVGYYIMKPKQIPSYVYRTYTLKTLRFLEKQDRILQHTDTSELQGLRIRENEEIKELTQITYEAIDMSINESDYFNHKEIYNSMND